MLRCPTEDAWAPDERSRFAPRASGDTPGVPDTPLQRAASNFSRITKPTSKRAAQSGMSGASRETAMVAMAAVWRLIQRVASFWDRLSTQDKATLRAFFKETKGEPRQMAARAKVEREDIIRIVRKGLNSPGA
jgi:hypothetical protein